MNKRIEALGNTMLQKIDAIGFQLDEIGVENQINRHTLIARFMFGQKRIEGELDSLNARVESTKANVVSTIALAEKYAKSGIEVLSFPATYAYARIKQNA